MKPVEVATAEGVRCWSEAGAADALTRLLPGDAPLELEIGFGKGRFLLERAAALPERRFLGIEVASEYFRLAARRLGRRRLTNLALLRGEALALLTTTVPRRAVAHLHVYFPDPWPKSRHSRRRLLAPETIDLLFAALAPAGTLSFATDHLAYGVEVERVLSGYPGLSYRRLDAGWPDGPRTHYEAKYVAEGRPILRLEMALEGEAQLHPLGVSEISVAAVTRSDTASDGDAAA